MISNGVVVMVPVEIDQDEEASEPVSSPPETPGDPIIEIAICEGGRIISHDRRFAVVVVVLDNGGFHVFGSLRSRSGRA